MDLKYLSTYRLRWCASLWEPFMYMGLLAREMRPLSFMTFYDISVVPMLSVSMSQKVSTWQLFISGKIISRNTELCGPAWSLINSAGQRYNVNYERLVKARQRLNWGTQANPTLSKVHSILSITIHHTLQRWQAAWHQLSNCTRILRAPQ
jgi:hypothetical protein